MLLVNADNTSMKTTSILYIFISLSGLFFASSVFALSTSLVKKGDYVLVDRNGETKYAEVGNYQKTKNGEYNYTLTIRERNKKLVNTSNSFGAKKNQLVLPAEQITQTLQDKPRVIKKGLVILGPGKKIYVVEDVFQNGKIAVTPLRTSLTSRPSERVSKNFTRAWKANVEILNKEDILAVEVPFYRDYKKGGVYKQILGMPVCDAIGVRAYQLSPDLRSEKNIRFNCGRKQEGVSINALFSDGTMAINSYIFNPFPRSQEKYIKAPEPHQEAQSQQ